MINSILNSMINSIYSNYKYLFFVILLCNPDYM